jgi:hypothetical protein
MRLAQDLSFTEQQMVHRLFTIRWTHSCMYSRVHGAEDDAMTRWQIDTWARVIEEVIPQLGGDYVSIIDTRSIGIIPRGLWMALVQLAAGMSRKPLRRALLAADGAAGDEQAQAAQLVTAGSVRVFHDDQREAMIAWLAEPGTIDVQRLRMFLS